MYKRDCIAIIPARGGSKRVPGKNIRPLRGRPLIAYTIEAARESELFARVVVSTDSEEIARVALASGAEVPFLRPAALADDHTPVSEATADTLERMDPDGSRYAYVAQLMPNCPLRLADDVRASFQVFAESGAEAQISVVDFGWTNPWWAMQLGKNAELQPVFADRLNARSQDLPPLYAPTGALWWAQTAVLRARRTFHVSGRTGYPISWHRSLDIDTEDDWAMAEFLIRYNAEVTDP